MPKLKFIFGTINSISVGMPEQQIETLYQNTFKPFLGTLYNFPEIAITLQYSGALLSWLDARHSEFTDVLSEMAARKQVELLGGAFYDPILTVIPRSDRLGQIESLTTWLRKRFGRRPRGGWLAETEWEPSLASTLSTCGMDYVFLGDGNFRAAGITSAELYGPYITEDQGKTLTVFPLSGRIEGLFSPFEPEQILKELRRLYSAKEDRLVSVLIDGTCLGGYPESRAVCYGEKQFERLLELLRDAGDWLEPYHPGRYLRQNIPQRKAYFPCRSPQDADAASGCHFFRWFLTRYPESNGLYAKMQYTHILVNQIRGDKYRKASALEELWKGQYGAAYWPAPGGGLYDNGLRKTVYRSLISAEKVTREQGVFIPSIVTADFDMDCRTEYLYQGNEMNAYIHTLGARLFELDYLPIAWNYLDTMARHIDEYSRKAFIDHFFSPETGLDDFDSMDFPRKGSFAEAPFEVIKCDRDHSELVLEHIGPLAVDGVSGKIKIVKKFIFKKASINLYYTLKNVGSEPLSFVFGSEINLSFLSRDAENLRIYRHDDESRTPLSPEKSVLEGITGLVYEDGINETAVSVSTLEPAEAWSLPVDTLHPGPAGTSRVYQSSCLVPRWKISLEPQSAWENRINLRMDRL